LNLPLSLVKKISSFAQAVMEIFNFFSINRLLDHSVYYLPLICNGYEPKHKKIKYFFISNVIIYNIGGKERSLNNFNHYNQMN
jgi:hypothetical protein